MGKPPEPQVSVTDTADIKVWFASQFVLTGFFIGQWHGWAGRIWVKTAKWFIRLLVMA